jgi:hypothetical protein
MEYEMKLINYSKIIFLFFVLFFGSHLKAQFTIERSVFSSGGGITSSGNNNLSGTIGQIFTGSTSNSNFSIQSGFWFANQTPVGVEDEELIPTVYELYQNFPNPFNPSTKIKYSIPEASHVLIEIFNLLGEKIASLVNTEQKAGFYTVDFNASFLSSGFYIYRIQANNFVKVKKMVLLK